MSRRWLVGLGIATACGGPLRARAPEAGADYLQAIRIEGNHAIATDVLEPALALHEALHDALAIDPYLLTVDTDRIRAAYVKRGFFGVQVDSRVEHRDGHAQIVVFKITEGRRAVTRVEITGLPPELSPARARALVALGEGEPFDYERYDAAKQPLLALVENAGYADARVDGTVDGEEATAIVRYQVLPGLRSTFGKVQVRVGCTGHLPASLEAAVKARLRFAEGDRYSRSAIEASQAEIYDLGRFSAVTIGPDHCPGAAGEGAAGEGVGVHGGVIDVVVEVSEANRHELHAGGGFGYEPAIYLVRLRGGGSLVPAALPLMTLAADAQVAATILDTDHPEPKIRGLVSLQYLDLLWPRLRGEAEVGADYQTVEAYTWTGGHVRLGLGSPLGARWLQLRVGWVFEDLWFTPGSELTPPGCVPPPACALFGLDCAGPTAAQKLGLCGSQLRGAYQASLVADLRDNPIEPHRGFYADLRVTKGTRLAGGGLTYLQLTPELRGYFPLGGVVLAARARVGAIFGEVPATERYYSGGTSGQRGFKERNLSPTASECAGGGASALIGGAGLIEAGVEVRRQLGTLGSLPVGANVFLDGGDVRCTPEELDPGHLHWAVGTGVWAKLVGDLKLRIDLGYRLNRQSSDTDMFANFAPHIGVGEVY